MIYTNMNVSDVSIYNYKTGEEMFKIEAPELSTEEWCTKERTRSFLGGTASFEIDNSYINSDALNSLLGVGVKPTKYSIQGDKVLYQKQIRTHKKHRINKKWAKKYGFRDVIGTYKADMVSGDYNTKDNTFECEFTNYRLIKVDGKLI